MVLITEGNIFISIAPEQQERGPSPQLGSLNQTAKVQSKV